MIENVYILRFPEGQKTCDYNALADAITVQYFALPAEMRKPITIANDFDAGLAVAHILEQRGKVPVNLTFLRKLISRKENL